MRSTHPSTLSLRANFAWTFAGRMVYAGCQWGMLTVLAKLTGPELVGRYALALAVTAPVFMLTNLQLRGVQATDARREYAFGHYLSLRLAMTALALTLVAGLVLFGGYRIEVAAVVLAVGLAKAVEAVSDVYFGYLQGRERMDVSARALILKGVLSLAAMAGAVILTGSVLWGALALAAAWAAVFGVYVLRHAGTVAADDGAESSLRPLWHWRHMTGLAWLALPLGLVMMLISLNTNIPRYFIENTLGEAGLGYFAAMASFQVAGTTVVGALGQAASPRLAQYYAAGRRPEFARLLARMVMMGAALGVAGVGASLIVGRPLLMLLYRPEYAERPDVFVWLMVAAGLSYVASFLGYGMTAARRFGPQLPLFAATVAVCATACALWVPRVGMVGAAWSLAAMAVVQSVGSSYIVWRALGNRATHEVAAV
jgi:O-antigen/teichoic acid export membrane protein